MLGYHPRRVAGGRFNLHSVSGRCIDQFCWLQNQSLPTHFESVHTKVHYPVCIHTWTLFCLNIFLQLVITPPHTWLSWGPTSYRLDLLTSAFVGTPLWCQSSWQSIRVCFLPSPVLWTQSVWLPSARTCWGTYWRLGLCHLLPRGVFIWKTQYIRLHFFACIHSKKSW